MINTLEDFKSQGLLCNPKQIIINHVFWKQNWYNKQKGVIYEVPHTRMVPFLQLKGKLKFRTWRLPSSCCKSLLSTFVTQFLLEIKPSQTSYQCIATLFIVFNLTWAFIILDWFMLWYHHLFSLITFEPKSQVTQKGRNVKTVTFLQCSCDQVHWNNLPPWKQWHYELQPY